MNEKQTQLDWVFGLQWFIVCALGIAIGGTLAFFTMWSAAEVAGDAVGEIIGAFVGGGLFGLLFALGASVGPGFLLGRKGFSAARWIIYSCAAAAAGMGITLAAAFSLVDDMSDPAAAVLIGLSLGLPIGIGQWLALKQQGVPANEWPLISLAAFFLAAVVITMAPEDSNYSIIAAGLLVGAVTGLGIVWSQRRRTAVAA